MVFMVESGFSKLDPGWDPNGYAAWFKVVPLQYISTSIIYKWVKNYPIKMNSGD